MKKILIFFLFSFSLLHSQDDPFSQVGVPGAFIYTDLREALKESESVSKMKLTGPQEPKLWAKFSKITGLSAIRFKENSISQLPPSLTSNSSLMFLGSSGNPLTELPEDIGTLRNLMYLELEGCSLDSIPVSAGALTRLKSIVISENRDTLNIPSSIGYCASLTAIFIDRTLLDTIPAELYKLENLETLWMTNCGISVLPDSIGTLRNLKTLVLDNNRITSLPSGIYELKNLSKLSLRNTGIINLSDFVVKMESLAELDLRGNGVGDYEADILRILLPGCRILR